MAALPRKDVVIVGYGAAAGPISVELSRAGRSVVALERGPMRTTVEDFGTQTLDTLRYVTRREMVPPRSEMPLTFRADPSAPAQPTDYLMASTVGGASVHWSGQAFRFYEEDFRLRSMLRERYGKERLAYLDEDGADLRDWPLTYEEVEPYYDKTERCIGIGGWPGNIAGRIRPVDADQGNPFESPRSDDFPFRPLRDNATDLAFNEGARKLGLQPFHVPTAITTEPYESPYGILRAPCTYCAMCTWHGCWNGSKSSTLVSLLPAAEASGDFELRPRSHVLRINRSGGRATSVDYLDLDTGEAHTQPGDLFVLAAYTFQNIRLLLHSGIDGGGQVGRYFMNRSGPSLSAVFDDRYLNGYNGPAVQRSGVDEFNGENHADEKLALPPEEFFVRGGFIGSPSQRNPLETYDDVPPDVPRWGAAYKAYLVDNLNRYIKLQFVPEPLPYESSYVDLDPSATDRWGMPAARVHRQAKRNEVNMSRFLYGKGVEILEAAGAARTWGRADPDVRATTSHDCGGLRMGSDPAISVTNRYGQMWQVPNVFVGGGGLFPTMSGHNPTQTIWMLSYWTADAIIDGRADPADAEALG